MDHARPTQNARHLPSCSLGRVCLLLRILCISSGHLHVGDACQRQPFASFFPSALGMHIDRGILLHAISLASGSREQLQYDYWVVTETDLCVLSKTLVPFHSLDIKRKIPLSYINRCFVSTNGHGLLDRWGASWPVLFVGTTSKERLEFAIWGGALTESAWFLQPVLDQRDALRSLEAMEVFA
jgi:hypothetical protein